MGPQGGATHPALVEEAQSHCCHLCCKHHQDDQEELWIRERRERWRDIDRERKERGIETDRERAKEKQRERERKTD